MRRVVVTGIGATTPLAGNATESWKSLLEGKSGISTLEQEWVARHELPVTFAAQAKVAASEVLTPQEAKRLDPSSQFALISAREAWVDAGEPEVEPERLAVDFATGIGGVWTLLDAYDALNERGPRRVLPMTVPMLMPNGPAAAVGMALGARAGVRTAVSACASGNESIANAFHRIQLGEADMNDCVALWSSMVLRRVRLSPRVVGSAATSSLGTTVTALCNSVLGWTTAASRRLTAGE